MTPTQLVTQDSTGELFTDSTVIAEGVETSHSNIIQNLDKNIERFEELGGVHFENRPFETAGGTQTRRVARLNEQQASLMIVLLRNTPRVLDFKVELVKAFYVMAEQLQKPAQLTDDQIMHQALQISTRRIQQLEERNKELEPKARFAESFIESDADYDVRDAAQILSRDHDISIGQNRLFSQLRSWGWLDAKNRPYQKSIDAGYLTEKMYSTVQNRRTGTSFTPQPQVRVTTRGIARIAAKLTGTKTG